MTESENKVETPKEASIDWPGLAGKNTFLLPYPNPNLNSLTNYVIRGFLSVTTPLPQMLRSCLIHLCICSRCLR